MAISTDGVVGANGPNGPTIPWKLSPDMKRFKALTMGHAIIMGRVTFDSIGKPLPGRTSIVVTRQNHEPVEGVLFVGSPEEALCRAAAVDPDPAPFVIGGPQIWKVLWPAVDVVELTRVELDIAPGFPPEDLVRYVPPIFGWKEIPIDQGEHNGIPYKFLRYERPKEIT